MKKALALAFAVLFATCLFHFYFAEDHCPVHCPSRGGRIGHVHAHHAGASVCFCFWFSLFGPEADDIAPAGALEIFVAPPEAGRVVAMLVSDITPPPRSSLV